ncbi:MAG: porin family protein [Bacteroidota bacterium]
MTNRFFFLIAGLLFSVTAFAQVEFGLKAGLATESLQEMRLDLSQSGREDLGVAIANADYGFQFGALLRIPLSDRFDLQTEVTFNSAKTDFSFEDPDQNATVFLGERYNDINVPIMGSWKIAFLRFNAGPVGHFFVSSVSDLRDADGRERAWDSFNLGYTLGGAIDIGKITIDVRYDGNFSKYGEDFAIAGETFRVDQAPKRWIGSVAYRF